jgi:membrane-associated protease RseP (regulator of RpoE activity)
VLLFFLTLATTVQSGGMLVGRILAYENLGFWWFVPDGLRFGVSLLFFLTVHEFGHYFAARFHQIDTSLPYYIPFPLFGIGTFGAVIRIREPIPSTRKLFDVGAAGPLAGFVAALVVLLYALITLPPPEYMLSQSGHDLLKAYIERNGQFPPNQLSDAVSSGGTLMVGSTPLYWFLTQFFPNVPPMYEMYHYPVLFAGWLGLFFTAFNLVPVGQLDGGHILYSLFGARWHRRLAYGFFLILLVSGAIGFMMDPMPGLVEARIALGPFVWVVLSAAVYFFLARIFRGEHRFIAPVLLGIVALVAVLKAMVPEAIQYGYFGWLLFCLLIVFFVRVEHPPVLYTEPLSPGRRVLAYLCIIIFFLCFSIKPLYMI